jgi:hypothetical protein
MKIEIKNMKKQNRVKKCSKPQNKGTSAFLSEDNPSIQIKNEDDLECKPISYVISDDKCLINIEDKNKEYWTKDTEQAVVDFLYLNEFFYEARIKEEIDAAEEENRVLNKFYCEEMRRKMNEIKLITDRETLREKIFKEKIEVPLKKLIENILFNFKLFIPGIDSKTQQKDCFTFLYLKFVNFNPWQKTKSFSYFGTIAKHYFLGNKKEYSKNLKVLYDYDSSKEEINNEKMESPSPYVKEEITYDLFNFIIDYIDKELDKNTLSKNDQKVGDAILQIFKNHGLIGVYSKNQIYQLIKEITCLETKDITYSLHRFRVSYKALKKEFMKKREI